MWFYRCSWCFSKFFFFLDLDFLLGVDVDLLCNDNDIDEFGEMVLRNVYIIIFLLFLVLKIIIIVI